jgi:hypothetical protein
MLTKRILVLLLFGLTLPAHAHAWVDSCLDYAGGTSGFWWTIDTLHDSISWTVKKDQVYPSVA